MTATSIEWADHVWNPLAGCTVLSPGCTNCYAMRMAYRLEAMAEAALTKPAHPDPEHRRGIEGPLAHYLGTTRMSRGGPVWTGRIGFSEHALLAPLRRRKPTRWFVNSMSDLFHEAVPDATIDRIFAVMALCPQHTFQVLTKRSARMRGYVQSRAHQGRREAIIVEMFATRESPDIAIAWPLPNVWLGVSVEDQPRADQRIPDLLATPAAVRWISAEPLLGPVDLGNVDFRLSKLGCGTVDVLDHEVASGLDWIVAGGESGPGARGSTGEVEAWLRSLRDQCATAGVPYFAKQNFRKLPLPADLLIREFPA